MFLVSNSLKVQTVLKLLSSLNTIVCKLLNINSISSSENLPKLLCIKQMTTDYIAQIYVKYN